MLQKVSERLKTGLAKENVPFSEYWKRCLSKNLSGEVCLRNADNRWELFWQKKCC